MSEADEVKFDPENFAGKVRLFPLPNLVMFPHVMQPLHVFEPRYRQMVENALADDRLIAMALLAPGWENDYEGRPPLRPVACLTQIVASQPLDDGRYNILVVGLRRLRLVRELAPVYAFREAEVALVDDVYASSAGAARPALERQLVEAFAKIVPSLAGAGEQLDQLLSSDVPLGMLTDIISYALGLELSVKEQLLAESHIDRRAELLLEHLVKAPVTGHWPTFPPDFSAN